MSEPKTPEQVVRLLGRRELEVLELLALGLENSDIGERLSIGEATVKTYVSRLREKTQIADRISLALFYVQHVLPHQQPRGYKPGQKLAEWRERAVAVRASLRAAGALSWRNIDAAMLLANPEHAGKSNVQLGALLSDAGSGRPLSAEAFKSRLKKITRWLSGGHNARVEMAVIAYLAPLDQTDEQPRG